MRKRILVLWLIVCLNGYASDRMDRVLNLWSDQKRVLAVEEFLSSLQDSSRDKKAKNAAEEGLDYQIAFSKYLELKVKERAKMVDEYERLYEMHPNEVGFCFLLSSAYASQGCFEKFFPTFYQAYSISPDHFFAKKSKALLYRMLFDWTPNLNSREGYRRQFIEEASAALDIEPRDFLLMKEVFALSKGLQYEALVSHYLKKIVNDHMIVPRSEIEYFAELMMKQNEQALLHEWLLALKAEYPTSRAIKRVEKKLN